MGVNYVRLKVIYINPEKNMAKSSTKDLTILIILYFSHGIRTQECLLNFPEEKQRGMSERLSIKRRKDKNNREHLKENILNENWKCTFLLSKLFSKSTNEEENIVFTSSSPKSVQSRDGLRGFITSHIHVPGTII